LKRPSLYFRFYTLQNGQHHHRTSQYTRRYYTLQNPESTASVIFHYLPFTSPVVVMVKLGLGYPDGQEYTLYISLLILFLSAIFTLFIAGRLYKNGILQFGHRVRLVTLLKWLKNT
jgi:ABC-2 type transport system permease protein